MGDGDRDRPARASSQQLHASEALLRQRPQPPGGETARALSEQQGTWTRGRGLGWRRAGGLAGGRASTVSSECAPARWATSAPPAALRCAAAAACSLRSQRPAPSSQNHQKQRVRPASEQQLAAGAGVGWGPDRDWTAEWVPATHTARRNSWPARTELLSQSPKGRPLPQAPFRPPCKLARMA